MKSKVKPGYSCFQIKVQDFKHRQFPTKTDYYVDRSGRGIREVVEHVPLLTLFRWAKNGKLAKKSAEKKGTVVSCQKVQSPYYRLKAIEYLRLEPKPIEVNISPDEFIVGRDLGVKPVVKGKKIHVNGT